MTAPICSICPGTVPADDRHLEREHTRGELSREFLRLLARCDELERRDAVEEDAVVDTIALPRDHDVLAAFLLALPNPDADRETLLDFARRAEELVRSVAADDWFVSDPAAVQVVSAFKTCGRVARLSDLARACRDEDGAPWTRQRMRAALLRAGRRGLVARRSRGRYEFLADVPELP